MEYNIFLYFKIFFRDEELRTSLILYPRYEFFNKNVEVEDQNVECEKLSTELPMYRNLKNLCYKLSRNINVLCRPLSESLEKNVYCNNLNYWLYDILIKSKLTNNEVNILKSEIINVLRKLWDTTNCKQICKLKEYNMNTEEFGYMKELYDYSKHYEIIEDYTRNRVAVGCKKQYCSYINKVDQIYKKVDQICPSEKDKPYCTIYNNIPKDKKPSEFFSQYECTQNDVDESLVDYAKIFGKEFQILEYDHDYRFPVSTMASGQELPDAPTEQLSDVQSQSASEKSPSNKSVKVGLSLFGMSSIPLFLIYKVKKNIFITKIAHFIFIMN
ncbi:hypothetical protein PVNG_02832 [Plasmodium vivax North Korean]|uniref:Uncharacterized protein n=1 Tax=Plasmodium vivax North Korean TaxID=1035514 RepID=A0A0J9W643_PLAVI|nr:hypothetical protein PVNG_02832 [Plasmodium vivax North Korean]